MKGEDGVEGGGDDRRSGGDGAGLTICIGIACWQKVGSEVEVESTRCMRLAVRLDMSWSRGRGERGLLGRGVSVSACAYTASCSATAYCLLPTACAVLLSAMYVYVCVCAESIHVVKQFYLGPRCVCVCGPTTRMVRPQSYHSSSRAAAAAAAAATIINTTIDTVEVPRQLTTDRPLHQHNLHLRWCHTV